MPVTVVLAEDNQVSRKLFARALKAAGYRVVEAPDGESALDSLDREGADLLIADIQMPGITGIELIERALARHPDLRTIVITGHISEEAVIGAVRNQACELLTKPFSMDELRDAVRKAIERPVECKIEVISAKPDWIEIRVPCDFEAVAPIKKLLAELHGNLPEDTREAIGAVFTELLNNAIEHGGLCDSSQRIDIKYIRLKRAVIYSIKDPGEGFNLDEIEHAAFTNPADDPIRHMKIRLEKGLRPGGFGIFLASQKVDELVYNERHNELIFVKYVDRLPETD